MPRTLIFDINETLLDLSVLDPHFEHLFGNPKLRHDWFKQVLQSALVSTILDRYEDFGTIAGNALEMIARRHELALTDAERGAVLSTVRSLPPHSDVLPGLTRLRDAGFTLSALTNSPPQVVRAQLSNAGISDFFAHQLTVDAVRRFKPAREVYDYAAQELDCAPDDLYLIAAHDWDIAGAMNAGWRGAFIARHGMVLSPNQPEPDIVGADLIAVAEAIIEREGMG